MSFNARILPSSVWSWRLRSASLRAKPRRVDPSRIFTVTMVHWKSGQRPSRGRMQWCARPSSPSGRRASCPCPRTVDRSATMLRSGPLLPPPPADHVAARAVALPAARSEEELLARGDLRGRCVGFGDLVLRPDQRDEAAQLGRLVEAEGRHAARVPLRMIAPISASLSARSLALLASAGARSPLVPPAPCSSRRRSVRISRRWRQDPAAVPPGGACPAGVRAGAGAGGRCGYPAP